eukprot:TRINITY_DN772_c0_g2_i1.p1 TRINITY_DN772_c0_g2~~TRINITY_DN772_c0_g2_i1.p1  ORF type:complete len:272 (+),score=68.12 TRINITY_DN772_c0_g2_i1:42-857(+)
MEENNNTNTSYDNHPLQLLYDDKDIPTFVDAITSACKSPDISKETLQQCAKKANKFAKKKSKTESLLNVDQIAAINLYTQESPFYRTLNKYLHQGNHQQLEPFFPILKILLSAFYTLPQEAVKVFRAVKEQLWDQYSAKDEKTWWCATSTTSDISVVLESELFLGVQGKRTLFSIEAKNAVDISSYSAIQKEREYILPPGSQFDIIAKLRTSDDSYMIQMKQKPLQILLKEFKFELSKKASGDNSLVKIEKEIPGRCTKDQKNKNENCSIQ